MVDGDRDVLPVRSGGPPHHRHGFCMSRTASLGRGDVLGLLGAYLQEMERERRKARELSKGLGRRVSRERDHGAAAVSAQRDSRLCRPSLSARLLERSIVHGDTIAIRENKERRKNTTNTNVINILHPLLTPSPEPSSPSVPSPSPSTSSNKPPSTAPPRSPQDERSFQGRPNPPLRPPRRQLGAQAEQTRLTGRRRRWYWGE